MKFVVSSTSLSSHLQTIGRVIASKNAIPILDCFLFEVEGSKLVITAADSETRMISSLEVSEVEGAGSFAVTSKNIIDSLKELPEQPITFELNDETLDLVVHYQNGEYKLPAQNGEEYPIAKTIDASLATIDIPASELLAGISRSLFATAEDELRPVMNGILFDIFEEELVFVASDGHKLVRFKNLAIKGNTKNSFILPKKPANLLKTVLPKETGTVKVSFDDNTARIELAQSTIITRLIEGRYPNYNGVIPTNNPFKLTVDRVLFTNALKRVSVFANQGNSLVKLVISENEMQISAQDIDYSTSAEEKLTCTYDGTPMNIGFKATFLIDILSNIPSSEVVVQLADQSRPGIILPAENETDEDLLMLLMPIMLND